MRLRVPSGPWAAPGLAAVLAATLVVLRLRDGMLGTYHGGNGAHLDAFNHRLGAVLLLRAWRAGEIGFLEALRLIDSGYPPLLHLVTTALVLPFDHARTATMVSGILWLFLFAWATGRLAGTLAPGGERGVVGQRATAAAASAVLGLGGLQALSLRYYYDLPMTALLQCALLALLLAAQHPPRHAFRGGLGAGALLAAACLTKWTALPFALIAGTGVALRAALLPRGMAARHAAALAGSAVAVGTLVGAWMAIVPTAGDPGSFADMAMTFGENPNSIPLPPALDAMLPRGLANALGIARWQLENGGWHWRDFYPRWLVWSILGPPVALLAGLLWVRWLLGGARGGAVLLVIAWGQWLFLLVFVPPLDERFFLHAASAVIAMAALGLASLPRQAFAAVGVLGFVGLFALATEFHFGKGPQLYEFDRPLVTRDPMSWRLRSASDPDGAWQRGDEPGVQAIALRQQLARVVERCRAQSVAIGAWDEAHAGIADAPVITDASWWSGVGLIRAVRFGGAQLGVVRSDEALRFGEDGPMLQVDLVVGPWGGAGPAEPPPGIPPELVVLLERLAPIGDAPLGAAIYRPVHAPPCAPR